MATVELCPRCHTPYHSIMAGCFAGSVFLSCFGCGHTIWLALGTKDAAMAMIRSFPDSYSQRHGR